MPADQPNAIPVAAGWPLVGSALALLRDPLAFLRAEAARLGPIFRIHAPTRPLLVLAGPQRWDEPQSKKVLTNIEFCVDVSGSMMAGFGGETRYDAAMHRIAQGYLQRTSRPELHGFLRHTFAELMAAYGGVVGLRMRAPNPRCIG